jgi:hypothetical protein
MQQIILVKQQTGLAHFLPSYGAGGCLMRSLTVRRYSTLAAISALAASAAQALTLNLELPLQQLQLAWTLTQVLLQL